MSRLGGLLETNIHAERAMLSISLLARQPRAEPDPVISVSGGKLYGNRTFFFLAVLLSSSIAWFDVVADNRRET